MTAPIKVAQVLAGAVQGGAENFYVRLVTGLQGQPGLQQQAFLRPHPKRVATLRDGGVAVQGFKFGGPLNQLDRRLYVRALRAYQPDIVLTWMNRASGLTPPGDYTLVSRLGHYYNLKYYRHADYWIGISKGICDHLVQGGMPSERVFHIPNFADEAEATALPRDSFATPADVPLLLAAGRLHDNKGFDTLLRALVAVPDAVLWMAGAGPEEQKLKTLCSELGLDSRVRFLGWRDDVSALMRTADLFVCPSRHEGLGSIVLESWAHRCPIIATRSQGPEELITDGETGLLTPVDAVAPLSDAINRLLGDEQQQQRLADHAARAYRASYSREVVVDSYRSLFSDLRGRR